jgi:hypothetical protein
VPVYHGTFRAVPVDIVLDDIRAQVDAGAEHISFGDPDFFNGPTHARRIVERLHARFPSLTYDVTIKIEHLLAHATLLPLLRDTGCLFVTSAVESVDDDVLVTLLKGHTRDDFERAVGVCRQVGLTLAPTFVPFHSVDNARPVSGSAGDDRAPRSDQRGRADSTRDSAARHVRNRVARIAGDSRSRAAPSIRHR